MKQNLLFVLPFLPYPMESGGHQALYNGIAAVKDDFNVFVMYEAWDTEYYRASVKDFLQHIPNAHVIPLLHGVHVETFKEKVVRKGKSLLKKVLSMEKDPAPVDPIKDTCGWWKTTVTPENKEWLELIHQTCLQYHIDIVQIEMPWRVSDVLVVPDGIKKVYVHHELGFVRRELEIKKMGDSVYAKACQSFADRNEIASLNLYDAVITLSPIDTQKLVSVGVKSPVYSSFAIIDSSKEIKEDKGDGKRLTFIGPEIHNPNFVGVTWFLENCWTDLKEKCPNMKLDIIGNWSEPRKEEYSAKYKDVHFLGFVDDLYEAIKDSTMIVPITIGSGIRMKILEASSKGIPFVSTSVGAEGIPVRNGQDCFIVDTPEAFVGSILNLQKTDLRHQFAINANKMVREHYSLDALRKNRLAIYERLLQHAQQ